jgi:hypothetical protein
MPYKFGEYVSTYVDPQSVKISETLRDRFVQNFQANDQLAMAVGQLQAASIFESDVQRKKELQRLTENELAKLAEQGNYENLGMAIAKQTKDYVKAKTPIEQNYKAVQTYLSEFDEGLKKGDYNPLQKQNLGKYMLRTASGEPYKGFELDPETGRVKEGTMFSGPTIYKDPKIMEKVTAGLALLMQRTHSSSSKSVAQGPDGMFTYDTGEKVVEIDPTDIQTVMNTVFAEPDVKAYVEQLADMQTYNFKANGQLPEVMQNQITGYTNALTQLETALNAKGTSSKDRLVIKEQMNSISAEIAKMQEASKDENAMYGYIAGRKRDEILAPYKELAKVKSGVIERTTHNDVGYDPMWEWSMKRAAEKADEEAKEGAKALETPGVVTATIYGNTVEEQMKNAGQFVVNAEALEKEAKDITNGLEFSVRRSKMLEAQNLRNQAGFIQQSIKGAGDQVINKEELRKKDPTLFNVLEELYPNKSGGEIAVLFQRTFDNPDDQDFIDFENKFNQKYGDKAFARHLEEYYYGKQTMGAGPANVEYINTNSKPGGNKSKSGVLVTFTDYGRGLTSLKGTFEINENKALGSALKEQKITVPFYTGELPGATEAQRKDLTEKVDKFFTNFSISPNATVTDVTSGTSTPMNGKELASYDVKGWKLSTILNKWELQLEGKPGTNVSPRTVIMDGSQLSSPEIREALAQPDVKLAGLASYYNTGIKGQERSFEVAMLNPDGSISDQKAKVTIISEGASNPLIQITEPGRSPGPKVYLNHPGVKPLFSNDLIVPTPEGKVQYVNGKYLL